LPLEEVRAALPQGTGLVEFRQYSPLDFRASKFGGEGLGHDFHDTPQGVRYTVSDATRRELLDHLLALNHRRHEEEVAAEALEHSNSGKFP